MLPADNTLLPSVDVATDGCRVILVSIHLENLRIFFFIIGRVECTLYLGRPFTSFSLVQQNSYPIYSKATHFHSTFFRDLHATLFSKEVVNKYHQGSHILLSTKFSDFSSIFNIFPGINIFFNMGSSYCWVDVL